MKAVLYSSLFIIHFSLIVSCARMGAPDGGWYDEKPPRVLGASPAENSTNVKTKKVAIYFDEYIKIESASEKVMISPPQLEQPEIKVRGRNIYVNLQDTLKPNTTYSIDFSDAIVDNNEGNPLGNYTYTFSTGDVIDTLEVSGYVIAAKDLEPVKGILVGLYAEGDTLMRRVARTNSLGRFVIRGVAPGTYTIGAVKDADGDYRFTQRTIVTTTKNWGPADGYTLIEEPSGFFLGTTVKYHRTVVCLSFYCCSHNIYSL